MIYWKFKYLRTQRALAVGVSEVWNRKKDPKLSKWADNMINKLNKKFEKSDKQ